MKTYETSYTTVKVIDSLHIDYCKKCGNQINYLDYGGRDYCEKQNYDCSKCPSPCTGLKKSWETGYMSRTVHGYCKQCGTYIEYGG